MGEILVILLVALLIVGPKKLPELSRSLGKGMREFRRVTGKAQEQVREVINVDLGMNLSDLNPFQSVLGPGSAAGAAAGQQPAGQPPAVNKAPVDPARPVDLGPPINGIAVSRSNPSTGDSAPAAAAAPPIPAPPTVDLGPPA
jgi:TatA/E family protein of Tat protein translocase